MNIPIYSEKSTLKEKLQNNTIDSIRNFDGKNLSFLTLQLVTGISNTLQTKQSL